MLLLFAYSLKCCNRTLQKPQVVMASTSPAEALGIRALHNVGTSFTSHLAYRVITAPCLPLFADPMTLTYSLFVTDAVFVSPHHLSWNP